MFSKNKQTEVDSQTPKTTPPSEKMPPAMETLSSTKMDMVSPHTPKPKTPPSILSTDLHVEGNLKTTGDLQIEGKVTGDIHAHFLTVGETAIIKGEIIADDIVINGRIVGRVRGLKIRLTSTAKVEGDIIHKTIAIESGAHFEGSVQRQDDPLNRGNTAPASTKAPVAPATSKAEAPPGTMPTSASGKSS